ncbi:MAG: hypothetical protein FJ318_01140 [SAR202 cluster bacterium]|nr:hypothetical protein [SAR202 cluster bacterium]
MAASRPEIGLFEAIYTARAIRKLRHDKPVSESDVRAIIEAGTQATNGANRQLWRFAVVRDPATKNRIGEWYRQAALRVLGPDDNPNPNHIANSGERYLQEHAGESPVIIFVVATPNYGQAVGEWKPVDAASAGYMCLPAVQNMLLAARGLGLGSNLTSAINMYEKEVKELLGIPDECKIVCMLPIGYPQGKHGPKTRKPVEEVTYSERWNQAPRF